MSKKSNIPKHIAIIMDGNRRWAKKRGWAMIRGHQHAVDNILEPLVDEGVRLGISHMTFWAWSTENWKRSKVEVKAVMRLFRKLFDEQIERLHRKGVRIQTIGDITKFSKDIQEKIAESVEKTKKNKNITMVFAINYGGRDEIIRAIKKSQKSKVPPNRRTGKSQKFTEEEFEKYLDTAEMPKVDMIIRPGGEKRLSGFLLWQSAYAELYFTDTLMPDFTPENLREAVKEYQRRERRFGK